MDVINAIILSVWMSTGVPPMAYSRSSPVPNVWKKAEAVATEVPPPFRDLPTVDLCERFPLPRNPWFPTAPTPKPRL